MNREELTQYSDLLYKYLLKLCQDPDTAEELVQETYYQAFLSSKSFEGRCSISTWLCQIGKNIWYKELRKRKQDSKLLHLVSTGEISGQDTASAEDSYELRERYRSLLKRIHSLDALAKEVVLLRLTGDLTFKEIAAIMEKSESWARVTYFRARRKLIDMEEEDEL